MGFAVFPPTMMSYRPAHCLNDVMFPGNVTQITHGVIEMSQRFFSVVFTMLLENIEVSEKHVFRKGF